MKKLFAIVAVAAMFAACGGNKPAETTDSAAVDTTTVVAADTAAVDTAAVDTAVAQ